MSFAFSGIRWFPILTCALAASANVWYFVSTGTNKGDYIGIGFFAVFAVGAFRRWTLGRDRFHLVTSAGAVVALGVMALHGTYRFDPGSVLPYLLFILFCLFGSILSSPSKKGGHA